MPSNKKKVLFTSHTANFQKFNRPFMQMLREQGYEVHYASMGEEQIEDCDKQFVVPFTRSPFTLSNVRAYRQLKEIVDHEQYDLIHTHTPVGGVVTRLAARQARQRGTRVIYTAHGFHFFTGAPLLNWLVYYPIERLMAHYTDVLITINAEDYARANRHFATNVVYVPGVGVDSGRFIPKLTTGEKHALRRSLGLKQSDFVMVYLAELSKRKNQLWLLAALRPLLEASTEVHLLLAGQDSLHGQIERYLARYCLAGHVHLLGYRNDVHQLLQIADLSVSSSKQEGLPVHLMEAMFAGLPIVTTRCRGTTELVKDNKNGFVTGFDKQVFLQRVEQIRRDPKLAHRLGEQSRLQAHQYDLATISRTMEEIYNG